MSNPYFSGEIGRVRNSLVAALGGEDVILLEKAIARSEALGLDRTEPILSLLLSPKPSLHQFILLFC